jgi:hypothetical protein
MGTSKNFPTPSGGEWTPLKNDITDKFNGSKNISADRIIGGTIRALGGIGAPAGTSRQSSVGGGRSGGGSGGAGQGSARGGGRGGRRSVSRVVSGLGSFGRSVQEGGLGQALDRLGLDDLRGRPAAEVIARIAEHLCEGEDSLQHEILVDALKDALLEAAALQEDGNYEDLESALQAFFEANGVEGLIQAFLSSYVFDRVWQAVQTHCETKGSAAASNALGVAVGQACRSHVDDLIGETKRAGTFQTIGWFGRGGVELADQLVFDLETRLRAL